MQPDFQRLKDNTTRVNEEVNNKRNNGATDINQEHMSVYMMNKKCLKFNNRVGKNVKTHGKSKKVQKHKWRNVTKK